jgi:hypothetical protein
MTPVSVGAGLSAVGGNRPLGTPVGSSDLARPKSNIFTVPSGRSLMFAGLRSR